jgi:hypothetical protein
MNDQRVDVHKHGFPESKSQRLNDQSFSGECLARINSKKAKAVVNGAAKTGDILNPHHA